MPLSTSTLYRSIAQSYSAHHSWTPSKRPLGLQNTRSRQSHSLPLPQTANKMCRTTIYQFYCADCNGFLREHKSREYCTQVDQYYSKGFRSGQQWPNLPTASQSLGGAESSASWPDGYGKCALGETISTFTTRTRSNASSARGRETR